MALKFLGNQRNPGHSAAWMFTMPIDAQETQDDAWERQRRWLRDKVIGPPQATPHYTVEQLQVMGFVGVYENTQE